MRSGLDHSYPENLSGGGLIRSSGSWEALSNLRKEHAHCIGDERILGDSAFVSKTLESDKLSLIQATLRSKQGWTLNKLIRSVCHLCDVQEQLLLKRSRNNPCSKAKALICYWGTTELGLPASELALRLEISQQAVSKWIIKGQGLQERSAIQFPEIQD